MAYFIQGDNFDRPGGKSEKLVWDKIKEKLNKREILIFKYMIEIRE